MPRFDLNLDPINSLRAQLAKLSAQQNQLDVRISEQRNTLNSQLRQGDSAQAIEATQARLNSLQAERLRLRENRDGLRLEVDRTAEEFLRGRDPALMAEALDGGQPIALLPVRLETRYTEQRSTLRIRVYPDVLHVVQHNTALTDKERLAGMEYWRARFREDTAEAERIARDLSLAYGRSQAQWIIRVLSPDNLAQLGQDEVAPAFPDIPSIDAKAKATRALLLPDRWCAIGYAAGRREVFRVWSKRIPDELPMSPDWLNMENQHEPLFDGERRWLVDFDAALENGMALEITQAQINADLRRRRAPPFRLDDTLERLVVLGLEWTKDAAQSAAELAGLFAAQRDSRGLGFVPLGTPTNNTETAPSGYSPAEELTPPPTPAEKAALPKQKDALELFSEALGLPDGHLDSDGIAHAHLAEQRTALHMMNALWRGTFGSYLMERWNPPGGEDKDLFIQPKTIYDLRFYAMSYLRPAGPLPVLLVGNQPYGVLPVLGKNYIDAGNSALESGVAKVLNILRPMWEIASTKVPLLKDGDIVKAKDILQTAPWSQTAWYRDTDLPACFSKPTIKDNLIQTLLGAFGINKFWEASVSCMRFFSDPPYSARYLAGVPWVLADEKDPKSEAPAGASFTVAQNYLKKMADNPSDALLSKYQGGPALLQALVAYSVDKEKHETVVSTVSDAKEGMVLARSTPLLVNIEPPAQTEVSFEVRTPKELANVVIPNLTGQATLGQYVMQGIAAQDLTLPPSSASLAAGKLVNAVDKFYPIFRDIGLVRLSLNYLSTRSVGELNCAFKTTLDTFSYRLDAWYTARASRRLEDLRKQKASGVYVGGFGWVENLKPDARPDSEGYMLAPSIGQAATAAILRSGFVANHEQGAFNINLNSQRTQRALDILQGLTRDQPLAALYGYRIERSLRDKQLGKLIWPLRLAFPWRAAGNNANDEPQESVGARDVVDGVALREAWQTDAGAVNTRLNLIVANGQQPFLNLPADERQAFAAVMAEAVDLADAVSDLLMAEGVHQIVQGNLERAGAAMAVVDKQALPIQPQVARTPRGGVMYTQRVAVLCPTALAGIWPQDRPAKAEPRLNAWLAHMLGAPQRYQFSATVHRGDVIDHDPIVVGGDELGYSPLAAVLAATSISQQTHADQADTGLRGRLVKALVAKIAEPAGVTGLDIQQESSTPNSLGLGHFEALATTLRGLLDKMRPLTRKDLVVPEDVIEKTLPDEGEYPGVDTAELQGRAADLIADFVTLKDALAASLTADELLASLSALEDFFAAASWPAEVLAIDATGADPATREARASLAKDAVMVILQAKLDKVNAPLAPPPGEAISHGQLAQQAMDQIKILLGRDFPVLPIFELGDYAAEFNASLDQQDALTQQKPWQVSGWMTQLARVREGLDRFVGALSAHEALVDLSLPADFKVVQYPHRSGQVWAALPEAWKEPDGTPPDTSRVAEELKEFVASAPTAFKDINRNKPSLGLALHIPGELVQPELAGFVCDEWQEAIPDPFQTAGISFHYDAPGARPPQNILLALPPSLNQEHWRFDEVLDVVHEAWDLAKLRGVRPSDLGGGLGALLPANYLPQNYTGELPSVKVKDMLVQAVKNIAAMTALGKI